MLAWKRTKTGIVKILLVMVAMLVLMPFTPAQAQVSAQSDRFAQPAMPMTEALRRFAELTGYDVVFQEKLVEGLRSAPVVNARNAHHALTQLLAASSLVPRFTRRNAFILEPAGGVGSADITLEKIEVLSSAADGIAYRWYGEKLLERCLSALRRSNAMGLRSYDFMIYVWLSKDGRIESLKAIGGVDQEAVVQIAAEMLKGLVVGSTPPVNMPQPVGLRIIAQ